MSPGSRSWLPSMSSRDLRIECSEVQRSLEEPVYPVAGPVDGDDVRFTYGLALDVAAVLARHGYPPVRTGRDLLRVQRALFELIYEAG